ncbi:hypothetical protein FHR22_002249 [Sphingopyxis panaciterrae]|uniref:hypothetical protein n=1 Tax=Sphingopyxis panaciterrae TaxID=363841 RepID=UPI001423E1BD|nr:hypothetical protein [Sphingopyxis panaciterrae]NIJ37565.1 hypothetical protein [Sphingopyxis panaciterrae]
MSFAGFPLRRSARIVPPPPGESDFAGDLACWSLVERKLLSSARKAGVECLLRLEPADGTRPHWRPGDLVELGDISRADAAFEAMARLLPGPRHGAVSLLPGGWPVGDGCFRRNGARIRLPIASAAASETLDLLIFAGSPSGPALDSDLCGRLLSGTTIDLRIVGSYLHRAPRGPLLFVGDRTAAALARAILQEDERHPRLVLIERGRGDPSLLSEAIFPNRWWRDGTVRMAPRLVDAAILARALEAQRGQVGTAMGEGGHILVAGSSDDFLAVAWRGLGAFFGDGELVSLGAAGRLATIRL